MPELTLRSVLLALVLTVLLAMSNAFMALKLGILTSASIPAAIISMGLLRLFKNPSILENNAVQTAASAGEAVAGGIVYTIPALIIIQYWHGFDYWTNFFIAVSGGILGVLFSIPLRQVLVNEPTLKFPEGRAIAEVLKGSVADRGISDIVIGGVIGGLFELLQLGFKLLASQWSYWFVARKTLFGFGVGFSATMLGAGYLIGFDMALSIVLGAFIAWGVALPVVSHAHLGYLNHASAQEAVMSLWNSEMRYLGIGAMLCAGLWTFIKLIKPLQKNMMLSFRAFLSKKSTLQLARTDKDIPMPYIMMGVLTICVALFLFFQVIFPLEQVGLEGLWVQGLMVGMVMYVLIIGFLFSVITAYFSGMVGVSASPGSSVVIAGLLLAAWLMLCVLNSVVPTGLTHDQLKVAEAMTIVIGSVVTGIAAIANDNTQDLKVGQLVGATPWKQQLMLLMGVVVSSLVIPPVMQLLFDVYGIAGIMPHEGMDVAQSLPAPTAALLAAVTEAVFRHNLPWGLMLTGALIIVSLLFGYRLLKLERFMKLSILGVAIGMYLPLSSSFPLFLGGLISQFVVWRLHLQAEDGPGLLHQKKIGVMIACGLVAGSALMDVVLAVPFSVLHSADALQIIGDWWQPYSVFLSVFTVLALTIWIIHRVCRRP